MKVLHIEDCEPIFRLVQNICQDAIDVEFVESLALAKNRLKRGGVDVLLVDLGLCDSHGVETVKELLEYNLPIVVLTGEPTGKYIEEILSLGVADYIDKSAIRKVDISRRLRFAHEKSVRVRRMAGRKFSFGNIDALKSYISYSPFVTK